MSVKYTEIETPLGTTIVQRENEDGSLTSIPMDKANSDYQAYLDRDKPKAALSTPMVTVDEAEAI